MMEAKTWSRNHVCTCVVMADTTLLIKTNFPEISATPASQRNLHRWNLVSLKPMVAEIYEPVQSGIQCVVT